MFAPVCVSAYARPRHLARTIEALRNNLAAEKHELFVFSDGAKPGDEDKVAAVRKYLRSVKGFKNITVFERTENSRVRNNRGGMKEVLDAYGRIIFLEEDVISVPSFLSFMNAALRRYEDERRVFSITGWCPRFRRPPLPKGSTFFMSRFAGWGFGIWRDRFEKIREIGPDGLSALEANKEAIDRIEHYMGHDVLQMIRNEAEGRTNALDIRCCFHQAMTGELTLYPYPSLTQNIGLDGTGEHCGFAFGYSVPLIHNALSYEWPQDVAVDEKIASAYIKSFRLPFNLRLANRIANKLSRVTKAALAFKK